MKKDFTYKVYIEFGSDYGYDFIDVLEKISNVKKITFNDSWVGDIDLSLDWGNLVEQFEKHKTQLKNSGNKLNGLVLCTSSNIDQFYSSIVGQYLSLIFGQILLATTLSQGEVILSFSIEFEHYGSKEQVFIPGGKTGFDIEDKSIDFDKVYTWLKTNMSEITETQENNKTGRALNAILYYLNNGNTNPLNLIWLTHALEDLYSNPNQNDLSISESLINRIKLVLNEDHKKLIKHVYEKRSQLVHGRGNIPKWSGLGSTSSEEYYFEYEILSILLKTIRFMILKNISVLNFQEILVEEGLK